MLTFANEVVGLLANIFGIITFIYALWMGYKYNKRLAHANELVKVVFWCPSADGSQTLETRIRLPLLSVNVRMPRKDLTTLYLSQWLRESFFELRNMNFSFLVQENFQAFSEIAKGGKEMRLKCSNQAIFVKLFLAFHLADVFSGTRAEGRSEPEEVKEELENALNKVLVNNKPKSEVKLGVKAGADSIGVFKNLVEIAER